MAVTLHCLLLRFLLISIADAYRPMKAYYDIYWYLPDMEKLEHDPVKHTSPLPTKINGTLFEIPSPYYTSDYRIEESPYLRYYHYSLFEEERPYRLSPFYKQSSRWNSYESPQMLGCTCTTVFKRLKVLATCSVLTSRHVLTTATSTELVLRKRRKFKHFEDILGVWYDSNMNVYNSSLYATPARIHYHPRYLRPLNVNRSHPIPVYYDLALWTMTHRLYSGYYYGTTAKCARGTSYWTDFGSSTPGPSELAIIVGFQFIRAFKRNPMPWFKYGVRTRKHVQPCPKTEWGWFHCIRGNWARLGLDSGANYHRTFEGRSWRFDGLIGLNAISMKLRSYDMIHYFTPLDTHEVINFLYNSYMGLFKHEWLDFRFEESKNKPLQCKDPASLYWNWEIGDYRPYYYSDIPNY